MIDTFQMDFNIADFNIDIDYDGLNTRYMKPKITDGIPEEYLSYSYADKLANDIKIKKGSRHYAFVDGKFYFGDFIEALIVKNNYDVRTLTVSTLSLNENNVDSFKNLLDGNYVEKLNLIVSHYFYSHERNGLVPYIYKELDKNNKFQLVVCRSHCKICLIETYTGEKIVMHGSANLRSSENIEQIMIEENESLYDFNYNYQRNMIKRFKTIDKREE